MLPTAVNNIFLLIAKPKHIHGELTVGKLISHVHVVRLEEMVVTGDALTSEHIYVIVITSQPYGEKRPTVLFLCRTTGERLFRLYKRLTIFFLLHSLEPLKMLHLTR